MKVAVSIPDQIHAGVEALAKRLKQSRSALYARALREFVERHAPDELTRSMNAALEAAGEHDHSFSRKAARRVVRRVEW